MAQAYSAHENLSRSLSSLQGAGGAAELVAFLPLGDVWFPLDDAVVVVAEGRQLALAVGVVEGEEDALVRPLAADGALLPVLVGLVAVADAALAALRLEVAAELRG